MSVEDPVTQGIIEDVVAYIAYLVGLIRDWIWNLVQQAIGWITGLIASLTKWFTDALSGILKWMSDLLLSFTKWLQDLLAPIIAWLRDAWETIYNFTLDVIQRIGNYVSDLIAFVKSIGEQVIAAVVGWIQDAVNTVASVVQAVIDGIIEVVSAAKQAVVGFVQGIVSQIALIVQRTIDLVQAAWAALVTGAEALIREIGQRLVDIRDAFADLAVDVVKAVTDVGDEYVKPIRDVLRSFADSYIPARDEPTVVQMIEAMKGTRTSPGQMEVFRAFWRDGFADLAKRGPVYQTAFGFVFLLLTLIPSVIRIGGVLSETSVQEWNRAQPWQMLQPADAAQAFRHGLMDERTAMEEMRRAGYDDNRAEAIMRLTAAVPPEGDLLAMRFRGLLDDPGLDQALKQRGYDGQWMVRIRQAAKVIPPIQDLILMAVRDVWNPAAVELGQLDVGYPKELDEWTSKLGLDPEWSRRYWMAHWSLPSPQQGFEMLHRGVIEDKELDTLLQALDIAPGWRPRLKAIAFNPYTRVDIRRMHQLKVLTDEEVYEAHLELGYEPEKARKLTDFVLSLNRTAVTEDDVELGRLSRSAILGFYEDGVINRQTAQKLLQDIGHTIEAASLYLDAIDMADQRTERRAQSDLIIEQAEAGTLTFDQAQDKLRQLGLETVEVEKAIAKLLRTMARKVKLPTQDDGLKLYVEGFIQRGDLEDLLSRLGYAAKWRDAFMRQAEAKKGERAKQGRG